MSKLEAQRALKLAKYERDQARAQARVAAAPQPKATRPPVAPPIVTEDVSSPATGTCGHRSMNGRTCTREAGHAAKNHRYS